MLVGFFRTIAIIFIIYFALRFLVRYIFPMILGNYVKKKQQEMEDQMRNFQDSQRKPEGEVNIEYDNKKKQGSDDDGEYIDYEEVD